MQISDAIAEVLFDIKLPYQGGESRGITCTYHDIDPECITHAVLNSKGKPNRDEWAIDFNLTGDDDNGKPVVAITSGKVIVSDYLVDALCYFRVIIW